MQEMRAAELESRRPAWLKGHHAASPEPHPLAQLWNFVGGLREG